LQGAHATKLPHPSTFRIASKWGNERLVPALRKLPGFKEYHGGADAQTGRIVAVTIWETKEQAEGFRQAASDVLSDLSGLGVVMDQPQVFEQTVSA
jgi:heme-degrading monooxygenase HmoA